MPISNHFVAKYLDSLKNGTGYSANELERIKYSLLTICWEIEKIMYLLVFFIFTERVLIFLFLLLISVSIRSFAGGYHCHTSLACIIFSFSIYYLSIYVLPDILLDINVLFLLAFLSLFINIKFAPVLPLEKENLANTKNILYKKIMSSVITLTWLIISIVNIRNSIFVCALWIIHLQNIGLLIEHIRRRSKKWKRSSLEM